MTPKRTRSIARTIAALAVSAGLMYGCGQSEHDPTFGEGILAHLAEEAPAPEPRAPVDDPAWVAAFDVEQFRSPGVPFRPWTRWWWPGNDVEPTELRREIRLLADAGFGGVEIQPFAFGLPGDLPRDQIERVASYDSERYYQNLRVALEAARAAGIGVDLTAGAGWPTSSPAVQRADGLLGLTHESFRVEGGERVRIRFDRSRGKLVGVVGARIQEPGKPAGPGPLTLDPSELRVLDAFVSDDSELVWTAPPGHWQIVAFWSAPTGQTPIAYPAKRAAYIVNHFDRDRVRANYDYLFGSRTGLAPYFGDPLRAIFNDSFEFTTGRHFAEDFLEEFRARRGYDLRPFLPAVLALGYNNAHIRPARQQRPFSLPGVSERVMYDYDRTVSDLFIERFVSGTADWAHQRGLVSRLQPYGILFDVIRASGTADIPEAEQAFAGGSELFLKLVSSGALLENRPLVSAEALVFQGHDYMLTPQKAKLAIDKLFAAGVNHVVYHGTPYRYPLGDRGTVWNPWSSPVAPQLTFSTVIAESDNFWPYQKQFNEYVARVQYAMRLGRPSADVLVYYPFFGVVPRELVGPGLDLAAEEDSKRRLPRSERKRWLDANRDVLRELENHGIRWAWVNDAALQAATSKERELEIRGRRYRAVVLINVEEVQPETAERLAQLAEAEVPVYTHGTTPTRQPGYHDFRANDLRVREAMGAVRRSRRHPAFDSAPGLAAHLTRFLEGVVYASPRLLLSHRRVVLGDGGEILFLRNRWNSNVPAELRVPDSFAACYWLDPAAGTIYPASLSTESTVSWELASFGSVLFYCTPQNPLPETALATEPAGTPFEEADVIEVLDLWNLEVERPDGSRIRRSDISLFDWRDDPELRLNGAPGIYETSWEFPESPAGSRYLLDLGRVEAAAEVELNGRALATLLFAPFAVDITDAIHPGTNRLRITVTAPTRNGLLGRAMRGGAELRHLEGKALTALSAGLLGTVRIERIGPR